MRLLILFSGINEAGEAKVFREYITLPKQEGTNRNVRDGTATKQPFLISEAQFEDRYGAAYDQQKGSDLGYLDESNESTPHRYLKRWSLTHTKTERRVRLPLRKLTFDAKYEISGWLQPARKGQKPLHCRLKNIDSYTMDRSPQQRGYWVYTQQHNVTKALYWLQDPCDKETDQEFSQEQLEFDSSTVLAIVSLLSEKVFTLQDTSQHVGMTVSQVLKKIPLVRSTKVSAEQIFEFENQVLSKYNRAIAMHLTGQARELNKECVFIKSLLALKPEQTDLKRNQIESWTMQAQKQLKQHRWGGPTLDIKLGSAFAVARDRSFVDGLLYPQSANVKFPMLVSAAADAVVETLWYLGRKETAESERRVEDRSAYSTKDMDKLKEKQQELNLEPHSRDSLRKVPMVKKPKLDPQYNAEKDTERGVGLESLPFTLKHKENGVEGREFKTEGDFVVEMNQAILDWSEFLQPAPQLSDSHSPWDRRLQLNFTISDDLTKAKKFYERIAEFDFERAPLEHALLVVESTNRTFQASTTSSPKLFTVCKLLFTFPSGNHKRWPAKCILDDFSRHVLRDVLDSKNAKRRPKDTTAEYLLYSTVALVGRLHFLKTRDQYSFLSKKGIDLKRILDEIQVYFCSTTKAASCKPPFDTAKALVETACKTTVKAKP